MVCGFDKRVHSHHIIKKREFGSDEEENLVDLCPNHHWIADFGEERDRLEVLELIKKVTKKCGKEISSDEKKRLDDLAFALLEEMFNIDWSGKKHFEVEEHEKETWRDGFNYQSSIRWLTDRMGGANYIQHSLIQRRAEILLIMKLLRRELKKTKI